jgi:hypothetical protein
MIVMRWWWRWFLIAGLSMSIAGCATDEEDRDFFNRGWVRPKQGEEERIGALRSPSSAIGASPEDRRAPAF